MSMARIENLRKFRKALIENDGEDIMSSLVHDFGGKEGARTALAYIAEASNAFKLENRIRVFLGFISGVGATLVIGAIVRIFS